MDERPSRARKLKRLTLAVLLVAIVLLLGLVSSVVSRGFAGLEAARRERRRLLGEKQRLEIRVQALDETLRRLDQDPNSAEALARRELRWVRPGETVYYLVTPTPESVAVPLTEPTPTPILSLRE